MKIINVKHYRNKKLDIKNVAYCGLSYGYWADIYPVIKDMQDLSVLGKPRKLIVRGNLTATMANYRIWLFTRLEKPRIRGALISIHNGNYNALACWCKPRDCHCDIILEAAEKVGADHDALPT